MASEREIIYLAALLHDIGKFWQKADPDGVGKSKILSSDVKEMESTLCPVYRHRYSHKHVLWTAQFFKENNSLFSQIVQIEKSKISVDALMGIAAAHHKPDSANLLQLIIQKADHYASGADRSKEDSLGWKDAEEENDLNWDAFRRIKMRSIFEGVNPDEAEKEGYYPKYSYKLPVLPIQLNKEFFPKKDDGDIPDYVGLWTGFNTEFKFIQAKSFKVFSETLLFLLEKYTTRVPSSIVHLPDVSLYDHSKMVAAFAVSIYDYIKDNNQSSLNFADEKPFALIGGDLSGIQKFIYSIIARGAAKNLKGRSFYLELLVDSVVRRILDELDLFDANVVYASGGTFYIIAPNRKDLRDRLTKIEKEITTQLFSKHGTDLYLMLTSVPFGESELYYDASFKEEYKKGLRLSISSVWQKVAEDLGARKGKRFIYQLSTNYDEFFEPIDDGGDQSRDALTGELIKGRYRKLDENRQVNEYTFQQIELGKKLKGSQYWIQSRQPLTRLNEEEFKILDLPYYNYFISRDKLKSIDNYLTSVDNCRIIFFNSGPKLGKSASDHVDFLETVQKGINNIYGFTFYGGNDYPLSSKDKSPKTFEELAGVFFSNKNKEVRSYAPELVRLGILRMDVDRLGTIFQHGFSPSKRTFSRYSTLSRSLDFFFKGYLNKIWESDDEFNQYTQIIYSGGDDLFIVGKWDVLVRMAITIQKEFKEWVCNSDSFTLSGGMAIVGPKYPLLKAAILSERYEKQAKNHVFSFVRDKSTLEIKKNAFSIFDYDTYNDGSVKEIMFAFNWEHEMKFISELKDRLLKLIQTGMTQGTPSTLFDLMYKANFKFNIESNKYEITYLPVIWQAAYKFKRDIQATQNEDVKNFFNEWIHNLMQHRIVGNNNMTLTRYHPLQYLAVAARWASLENRSKIEN